MVSDAVLTSLGGLITKRLRPEDLKGRWGEDKLILAFRNEQQAVAEQLVSKLMNELVSMSFVDQHGIEFTPRLSCGFARMPTDGGSIHELLEAADHCLRQGPTLSAGNSVGAG